jgi:hypothetical protein
VIAPKKNVGSAQNIILLLNIKYLPVLFLALHAASDLLCKLIRLGIAELTDIEIKWLAHKFSGESEVSLF